MKNLIKHAISQEVFSFRNCNELTVHATVEEEIFDPATKEGIREVKEETSISDLQFSRDANFTQNIPGAGHSDTYYFVANSRANVFMPISQKLGKPKNDNFEWFSIDAARELLTRGYEKSWQG